MNRRGARWLFGGMLLAGPMQAPLAAPPLASVAAPLMPFPRCSAILCAYVGVADPLGARVGLYGLQSSGDVPRPVTAFVDVGVIPMDRERVLVHQTVVVRGDRIIALGPANQIRIPAGAIRVDGQGKYLIPGLADMHAHVIGAESGLFAILQREADNPSAVATFTDAERRYAERVLFLYAATGVTTVRNMSGPAALLHFRRQVVAEEMFVPRMYLAGPTQSNDPAVKDSFSKVPAWAKAQGYDLVKMYGLSGTSLDSLAAAARRVGIPIAGHVPGDPSRPDSGKSLAQAIQAGYVSIEHLSGLANDYGGYGGGGLLSPGQLAAQAMALRRAGIWICPTFMVNGLNAGYFTADTLDHWPELRYLSDSSRAKVRDHWSSFHRPPPIDTALHMMAVDRQIVRTLHDAGVGLLLGTDVGVPGLIPGFAVHRELMELVKAGLTPYEALATGTRNVAAYFGTLDSTGTVAVGKRADLVLLTGNPLRDIRETAHRAGVMLGGRWFAQAELEQRLATLVGTL